MMAKAMVLSINIYIFIAYSFNISYIPSSVQDRQESECAFFNGFEWSLMVVCWKRFILLSNPKFYVEGLKGVLCEARWLVPAFLWASIVHIVFCYTQVNVRGLTPITSIVLKQTTLRWFLLFPVNCDVVRHALYCCPLTFEFTNFSKMAFSITYMSLFHKRIALFLITYSDLFVTYLWKLCESYYQPVKQTEDFTERKAQENGRRWCCSEAAELRHFKG